MALGPAVALGPPVAVGPPVVLGEGGEGRVCGMWRDMAWGRPDAWHVRVHAHSTIVFVYDSLWSQVRGFSPDSLLHDTKSGIMYFDGSGVGCLGRRSLLWRLISRLFTAIEGDDLSDRLPKKSAVTVSLLCCCISVVARALAHCGSYTSRACRRQSLAQVACCFNMTSKASNSGKSQNHRSSENHRSSQNHRSSSKNYQKNRFQKKLQMEDRVIHMIAQVAGWTRITSVAIGQQTCHNCLVVRSWHDPCHAMAEEKSKASSAKSRSSQNHQEKLRMEDRVIHTIHQVAGCLGRQPLLSRHFTIVW